MPRTHSVDEEIKMRSFLERSRTKKETVWMPAAWTKDFKGKKIEGITGFSSSIIREATFMCLVVIDGEKVIFDPIRVNDPEYVNSIWFLFDCSGHQGATFNLVYNGKDKFIPVNRRNLKITNNMTPKPSVDFNDMTITDQKLLDDIIAASMQ